MIATIIYLNRFFLFPKLYLKKEYLWYWFFNILSLFFIAFLELQLTKPNIIKCCQNFLPPEELSWHLVYVFFLVTFRDAGFFAFFFIRRINQNFQKLLMQQEALLAIENKQIIINLTPEKNILLTIKDIVYISVEGKYSIVHLINTQKYKQIKTLNDFEKILPEHFCLRINRNTIIMYKYVCDYNDFSVTLNINNHGEEKVFSFFQNNNETILCKLKKHVSSEIKKMNYDVKRNEDPSKMRSKKNENCDINEISQQILEVIRSKPNIFASEIKRQLSHVSPRTIDNHLRELKDLGLIVYLGAAKNGGYYLV
jgi:DNA-binding transcriptional ArsR family regulator